jgi:hypothetical protein
MNRPVNWVERLSDLLVTAVKPVFETGWKDHKKIDVFKNNP